LGVTGFGVISQLINFQTLILFIGALGIPLGLTKLVSENADKDSEMVETILLNSIRINIFASLILSLLIILFSRIISSYLFDSVEYSLYIIILALFLPFAILTGVFEAFIRGIKKIGLLVKLSIVTAVSGFVLTVILVYFLRLDGAIYGIFVSSVISFVIYYVILRKKSLTPKFNIFRKFNRPLVVSLFKIGFFSLLSGAVAQFVLLIIRSITINKLGIYGNGIYQSVLTISINYFGFVFVSLTTYSFPKICSVNGNDEINEQLNINFRYVLFLMIPLIAFILTFREYVIYLLFTVDFSSSQPLYKYQFLGDLFKSVAWVFGLWLVPKLKLFTWLTLDIIFSVNFIVIYLLLLNFYSFSLESLSISYLISNVIHALLSFMVTKKFLRFKFNNKNLLTFIVGLIMLVLIIVISEQFKIIGYLIIIPLLVLWMIVSIRHNEYILIKRSFMNLFTRFR